MWHFVKCCCLFNDLSWKRDKKRKEKKKVRTSDEEKETTNNWLYGICFSLSRPNRFSIEKNRSNFIFEHPIWKELAVLSKDCKFCTTYFTIVENFTWELPVIYLLNEPKLKYLIFHYYKYIASIATILWAAFELSTNDSRFSVLSNRNFESRMCLAYMISI